MRVRGIGGLFGTQRDLPQTVSDRARGRSARQRTPRSVTWSRANTGGNEVPASFAYRSRAANARSVVCTEITVRARSCALLLAGRLAEPLGRAFDRKSTADALLVRLKPECESSPTLMLGVLSAERQCDGAWKRSRSLLSTLSKNRYQIRNRGCDSPSTKARRSRYRFTASPHVFQRAVRTTNAST